MNFQQNFSLPEITIISYILKNISSPKLYEKLIQSCKYFYKKNPILILHCLNHCFGSWFTCNKIGGKNCIELSDVLSYKKWKSIDIKRISNQIWVTNFLEINHAPLIDLKNCKFDIVQFTAWAQTISINELLIIGSSVKFCYFWDVIVKTEDGNEVSLGKIIQCFPLLEEFKFRGPNVSSVNSKSIKETSEDLLLSKIIKLELDEVPEDFDIEGFFQHFLKKNKTMDVELFFRDNISEGFNEKLEIVITKILELQTNDFWPPCIYGLSIGEMQSTLKDANYGYHKKILKR